MRTHFPPTRLDDPDIAAVERNLRACVHCGICTATCPTYLLTGDERDGPRGRIVMMQRMLELGGAPTAETVHHVDRCLSCLGCRTACPSSVDYARIVDAARQHIHAHHKRPRRERMLRAAIAFAMPRPTLVRFGLKLAHLFAPIATQLPGRLGRMAGKAVFAPLSRSTRPPMQIDERNAARRVALMPGCVQQAFAPSIDEASTRVLARRRMVLKRLDGAGCCGALAHHLGRRDEAKAWATRAITAFEKAGDMDAVLITATGCAAHLADYPHLFSDEPAWRVRAERFAAKAEDFSTLATPMRTTPRARLRVAHHVPCSLQHGLGRKERGEAALKAAGYEVREIPESHLCCGSAGSYSLLQPEMAEALRARKLAAITSLDVDAIASANIGCLVHLSGPDAPPVIHPAELLDWAEGGPAPAALARMKSTVASAKTG